MRFFFALLTLYLCLPLGMPLHAQERESCDPDFMLVLDARATLEGEREIEMAQDIISKPDSVLEYSCFAQDVNLYNQISASLFSNNDRSNKIFFRPVKRYIKDNEDDSIFAPNDIYQPTINSPSGPQPNSEGSAGPGSPIEGIAFFSHPPYPDDNEKKYPGIAHFSVNVSNVPETDEPDDENNVYSNMIGDSYNAYINGRFDDPNSEGNFYQTFLGGRVSDYLDTSNCDMMARIWDLMRCGQNFKMSYDDPNEASDPADAEENWFPTFEDLNPYEPRQLPKACNSPERGQLWDAGLAAANPEKNADGGLQTNRYCCQETEYDPFEIYPPMGEQTNIDFCRTAPPILTGLQTTINGKPYPDGFCARPGMAFFPDAPPDGQGRDTRCRFFHPKTAAFSYSSGGGSCP